MVGGRVRWIELAVLFGNSEFLVLLLLKSVVTVVETVFLKVTVYYLPSYNTVFGGFPVLFVSKNQRILGF